MYFLSYMGAYMIFLLCDTITVHEVADGIRARFPQVLIVQLADDTTVIGQRDEAVREIGRASCRERVLYTV